MERLIEKFRRKINTIHTDFIRSAMYSIHWEARLVGIKGSRGVGKTTLVLQHIKLNYMDRLDSVLYVSLDDLWFADHSLNELADDFVKSGGIRLYIDEVHSYPQWSIAVKNLYDDYPQLQIVFTGSSITRIIEARADLSRRAVVHTLQGLSFREYLALKDVETFPAYTLNDILADHQRIAEEILGRIKPLKYFPDYLRRGYYPFFLEGEDTYGFRLEEAILMLLEVEIPQLRRIETGNVIKLKKLLRIVAESVPFKPNTSKMSERLDIHRQTLLGYLHYLAEAKLIISLYTSSKGIKSLGKPEKIYLENSNLMYLLRDTVVEKGNVRETFFANQLSAVHTLHYPSAGDFLVDHTYTFEIGGKNKTSAQIAKVKQAYVAADDIEYGHGHTIPLWLFGFLY